LEGGQNSVEGWDGSLSSYYPVFPFWKHSGNLLLTSNVNIHHGWGCPIHSWTLNGGSARFG
jgi:hypothetical protein